MAEATHSQILERIADPVLALAAVLIAALVAPIAILPIVLFFALMGWVVHRGGFMGLVKSPSLALLGVVALAGWTIATIAWTIAPEATPPAALALAGAGVLGGVAAVLLARGTPPPPTHWAVFVIGAAAVALMVFNAAAGWAFLEGGAFIALLPILIFPVAAALRTRFGRGEAVLWIALALGLSVWSGGTAAAIAVGVGLFAFLMGGLSTIAARVLLTLILLLVAALLPLSVFLVGDVVISVSRDVFGAGNALEARLGGWGDVIAAWRENALFGLGAAAVPVSGGGGGFLRLLAETGFIGLGLSLVAIFLVIWTGVPRVAEDDTTWRAPASAGTIGAGLALGVGFAGIWSPWFLGGLALAAMILSACRLRPSGGALGSIFDLAPEEQAALAEEKPPPTEEWNVDPEAVDTAPEGFEDEPDAWEIEDIDDTRAPDEEESFSFDRLDPGDGRKT